MAAPNTAIAISAGFSFPILPIRGMKRMKIANAMRMLLCIERPEIKIAVPLPTELFDLSKCDQSAK